MRYAHQRTAGFDFFNHFIPLNELNWYDGKGYPKLNFYAVSVHIPSIITVNFIIPHLPSFVKHTAIFMCMCIHIHIIFHSKKIFQKNRIFFEMGIFCKDAVNVNML